MVRFRAREALQVHVFLYALGAVGGLLLLVLAVIGLRYVTRGTPVASVSGVDGNRELPQTDDDLLAAPLQG